MYDVLLFLHIVAAAIWIGGAFAGQVIALKAQRSSDPMDLIRLGHWLEFVGTRVYAPASIVVLVAGALMTMDRWSFGQLWIAIAIVLWLASFLSGILFLGPGTKRAAEAFEADGPTSAAGRALTARLFLVSRLELVGFLIIVGLMVFKPGS